MNIDTSMRQVPVREFCRERFVPILTAYAPLCSAGDIPSVDNALASDLALFLNDAHLMEFAGPGRIFYRLCGTEADDRMGGEFIGRNAADYMDPEMANAFHVVGTACCEQPCGAVFRYLTAQKNGRIVSTESLSLPVRSVRSEMPQMLVFHCVQNYAATAKASKEVRIGVDSADPLPVDFGSGIPAIFDDLDSLFDIEHHDQKQ